MKIRTPAEQVVSEPNSGAGIEPGSDGASLEDGTGFLLGKVHRTLRAAWEERLRDLGVSAPQAALLRGARAQPGTGIRALARVLGTDPMNARRLTLRLEQLGLVEVRPNPSGSRLRGIWVTGRGAATLERIAERAQAHEAQVQAILGPPGTHQLHELLQRLDRAAPEMG